MNGNTFSWLFQSWQQAHYSEGREVEDGICQNLDPVWRHSIISYGGKIRSVICFVCESIIMKDCHYKCWYFQPAEGVRYAEGVEEISEDELNSIAEELTKEELEELEVCWTDFAAGISFIFVLHSQVVRVAGHMKEELWRLLWMILQFILILPFS